MPHTETYVNGIWHPSVTTVLDIQDRPWLDKWKIKWQATKGRRSRAEWKLEMADKIGTEFHRCVEEYLDDGCFMIDCNISYNMSKRITQMMESFIDWAVNIEGTVEATELKVLSKLHTYSGTLDAVGTLEGQPIIFDWKTSSKIYDDMAIQLSAYAQAYKEQSGKEITQGIIVHVSKKKPHFKLSTKTFKLGKRVFNKFLKLKERFDEGL